MENLKAKRLKVLNDTVKTYNKTNRAVSGIGGCFYFKEGTVGCGVGRLIEDKELCKALDVPYDENGKSMNSTGVEFIFNRLPENVKELGVDFLKEIQLLHDARVHDFWDANGLTQVGVDQVERIKQVFELA